MKKSKMSGIQKKYLKYMCTLLILALVLSSICVWTYVRRNMTDVIVDKYEFMNEKMGIALDNLYRKTDAVTAEIILENDVQKSLKNKELQDVEKNALSKYFAYIDLNHVADYCYIDNKRNVYEKSYSQIGYSDFQSSGLREKMGDEYAKTQWIWTRDYLFGTGDEALFIGRYVNSMDYAHEPGIVYLKMNQQFLESVMDKDRKIAKDVAVGIISPEGKTCIRQEPEDLSIEKRTMKKITELTRTKKSGVIVRGKKIEGGILQAYRQEETGMVIFTLVPDMVLNQGMTQILIVLLTIYAVIAVLALWYAVGHWNAYFNAFLYLSNKQLYPLQIFLKDILVQNQFSADMLDPEVAQAMQNMQDLLKYSMIVIATVPVFCFYPFAQKYFVKGVMIGSVKG